MALVIVERAFESPQNFSDLQGRLRAVSFCFQTYRAKFLQSFFALDGKHMLCAYEAPDAEAVRSVQRTAGLPVTRVWAGSAIASGQQEAPSGFTLAVTQRELPPGLTEADVLQLTSDPAGCGERVSVTPVATFLSADRRRLCAAFYSPDLESIRAVGRESRWPLESLWEASRFVPPG